MDPPPVKSDPEAAPAPAAAAATPAAPEVKAETTTAAAADASVGHQDPTVSVRATVALKPPTAESLLAEHEAKTLALEKDETEDLDDQLESEFYDTRQQFLNLCQGNHYQFDSLRRAKHTSMMALYHIHNPDMPKFVINCVNCNDDINSGYRYDCETCNDFHLCAECYEAVGAQHPHKFKRITVQSDSQQQWTEEQRRQRQRSIGLHMTLLQHASSCRNTKCPSANCEKMKNLLAHGHKCQVKVQGGCNVCRRIWALLQIHAKQCRRDNCLVPKCRVLREQLRAIELQQDQMNERRRLAMNEQISEARSSAAGAGR